MNFRFNMKFLKRNLITDGTDKLDTLVVPIPYKSGDRFLRVDMSTSYKRSWGIVDFTDSTNKIAGIYTTGLTFCCAVSLIKKDSSGNILKAWLTHLPGGLNEKYLEDFPEELKQENIGTNQVEVVVKFGVSETFPNDEESYKSKLKDYTDIIKKKYPVAETQITMLDSENQNNTFAIHRNGMIGLTDENFPPCNISGDHTEITANSKIGARSYTKELDYFKQLIEVLPENSKKKM